MICLFHLLYLEISIVNTKSIINLDISRLCTLEISMVQCQEISRLILDFVCTIEISRKSRQNKQIILQNKEESFNFDTSS